ncbi:ABC transporter ATP-binding protein [Parabacteroides sp. PF5-9]|uniref:ABC transporter ATP-binding protein n=1 Tax=Parabacteroides sp. PF5-9 TaxID=1742404 RepID=UPI002473FAB9|nr:ABC transporter ATP-binding protein [Parabacteroides sp. PF5-9]MDH6358154.1 ATP-binding cassette subfamily B multidrug efflux pump [Parabacteroides sp. PF5-9]
MSRYWQILRKYRGNLLISPLLVLIGVVAETIQPYFMSQIVDDGIMRSDLSVITRTGILMLVASVIGLIASVINIYVSSKTSIGFGTDLRTALFGKIQQLAFPDIDRFSSASLITRLTNDVTRIQQVIMMGMRIMLRAPMMLVMAVFFIISINADLAIILAASIPLLGISIFIILYKGFPLFMVVQQKIDALNSVVRENLINIRVVKSFVREDFETQKFVRNSEELRDIVIKASNIIVSIFPVMHLIMNLSILAILWFGGSKVISEELKVGELISFVNYLMQILMSLMMLSMVIMTFARASASSERIVEVLEAEPSLKDFSHASNDRVKRGDITFHHVSFRYSGGENDVLKDINFHVAAGETIAVVGSTGSAKSSMVQLIPRLYDATAGEVLIDGVDVKTYPQQALHEAVGMVLQKNELFSGTILENLRWGDQEASFEQVVEAAKAAEAHEFILSFNEGYETVLGRGGVNVSGGQKQRLCIARALLRKPKILILDDSTSAVDSETELKIRRNLNSLFAQTTVFIITQRIHTMQSADRVIVLEDGEIDAMGTPEELLQSSKIYQEIYHSQQLSQ